MTKRGASEPRKAAAADPSPEVVDPPTATSQKVYWQTLAVTLLQTAVLASVFAVVFTLASSFLAPDPGAEIFAPQPIGVGGNDAASEAEQVEINRLSDEYDCTSRPDLSQSEFRHALIRNSSGNIKIVSLDAGWQIQLGRAPGSLLAVCTG